MDETPTPATTPTAAELPGPKGRPLLGNIKEFQNDRVPFFERLRRDYGRFVPFRVGNKRALLVVDVEATEEILGTQMDAFHRVPHYRANRLLFGEGLFRSGGDRWRRQHAMIEPTLTHDVVIDSYLPAMIDQATRAFDGWRDGQRLDAVLALLPVSLDAAVAALWGVDLAAEADDLRGTITRVYDGFDDRLNALIPWSIAIPNPRNLRLKRDLKRMDAFLFEQIRTRRLEQATGDDMLSRLVRAKDADGSPMADALIRDEVASAVQAAYRPTPVALGWAWYLLDANPDVERALLEELTSVLGDRDARANDLDRLPYARMTMLESLRLYSPVHMTGRVAVRDAVVQGHRISKGTTVLMEQHLNHRDPELFEDATEFRPRRWEDGLRDRLPGYAYIPFSAGPHGCVGADLAFQEMVAFLVLVARRFHVRPERTVEVSGEFLLQPKGGMPVVLEARTPG